MPQQEIYCTVNSCHYWNQGNKCEANKILVATENLSGTASKNFSYEMAAELTPQKVKSATETCCKTYVSKKSPQAKADGVSKMS